MKRKVYHIFLDDQLLLIRYAWNSATKAMREYLAARGKIEHQDFERVLFDGEVGDAANWRWKGNKLGNILIFRIERDKAL